MNAKALQNTQRQALTGKIAALAQQISKFAPHPDKPGCRGPLFIKSSPNARVASDHDGMLGMMMMETMLADVFSDAMSDTAGEWTKDLDLATTLECYSEYITDIEGKRDEQHIRAHGQGTLARLSGKKIANSFNMRGSISAGMQAFMDDLPARLQAEKELAYYLRQLEALDAPAPVYAPAPAAPAPRFAA